MAKVKIHVTGKLKTILNKIKSESWLAQALLMRDIDENLLVDKPVNYIRISGSDKNKISYLPPKKILGTVKQISEKHGKDLREGQIPVEYFYKSKGRVKIKYGSFINKVFKNVPPKDVEKFSSLVKSIVDQPDHTFRVVSGDDIRSYYHGSHHASSRGSLGVSCMRHDNCQDYFNIYCTSPEIKMVIMFDLSNRILARAILWHLDEKNGLDGEFKFMDRIYSTKDDQFHLFHEWAKKNGYTYKERQSWNTPYRFQFKDDVFHKKMKIKMKNPPHQWAKENGGPGLPYLDTFKWMDLNDGTLYNYKPDDESMDIKRNIYTPVSTKGRVYGFNYIKEDEQNLEFWYEGELKYVEYLDKWVSERYLHYSHVNQTHILKDHCIIEDYTGEFIFNEEYDDYNDNDSIDELIEKKKEKIRKEREKLEREVKSTMKHFSEFVERGDKFLDGVEKLNKESDLEKVIKNMTKLAVVGDKQGLSDLIDSKAEELMRSDDHPTLQIFISKARELMKVCENSKKISYEEYNSIMTKAKR